MSPRRIAVLAAATVLTALGAVAPVTPAHAAVMVPARPPAGGVVGAAVTVAARSFPAGARFVSARVLARHATTSARRPMMLSVKLTCGSESVQATTNVVTSVLLTPRRLMADPTDCRVVANSAMSRATTDDGLTVTATISAVGVDWGATGHDAYSWPAVLRPGDRYDAVPVTATVPEQASSVRLTGDIKVTTCTSVGGSRENGSPSLCAAGRVRKAGSRLRVSLIAAQHRTGGGYCGVTVVSTRAVHVNAQVHHGMVAQAGTYPLSQSSQCARSVTVLVLTQLLSGADVLVHRRGSISNVYG